MGVLIDNYLRVVHSLFIISSVYYTVQQRMVVSSFTERAFSRQSNERIRFQHTS